MKLFALLYLFLGFFFYSSAQSVVFDWAKSFGGTSGDSGYETLTDAAGNVYVMGNFVGTVDMDPGAGVYPVTSAGFGDNFISKFDAAGNFLWSKTFGNLMDDNCISFQLDNGGNIFLTGHFYQTVDFDPGSAVFNLTCNTTGYAVFLLKLDANGNFVWAKKLVENEYGNSGLAVNSLPTGDIVVAGRFKGSADFDPGAGVFIMSTNPVIDEIFILKLNSSGNFLWAKQFGTSSGQGFYSMVSDDQANIYLTGTFYGTCDFDPGAGIFNLSASNSDTYILKLSSSGNLVFAKQLSPAGDDRGWGITLDGAGSILVTGEFSGAGDFDPGAGSFLLDAGLYSDGYVLKLNSLGNFMWAKQFGSLGLPQSASRSFAIAVDNAGDVYTTGDFHGSVDFDPSPGGYVLNTASLEASFISKLDGAGNFIFALPLLGSYFTQSAHIMVDAQRNITVTGRYIGTADFDPTIAGTYSLSSVGSSDVFLLKLKQNCAQVTTSNMTVTACNQYMLNNQVYSTSGVFTQMLTNAAGCDSILTLHLTIGGSTTQLAAEACDSYLWEGQYYSSSGAYSVTYTDAAGCDSILNLALVINHSVTSQVSASICQGQTFEGYSTAGVYTDLFTGTNGCDSTRTLTLTVKPISVSTINASICQGQQFEGYAVAGTYIDVFVASNGCDSTRTLNLSINPVKITNRQISICDGQTYYVGGANQSATGVYRDTLQTYLNCDSIIITNLTVRAKPHINLGADRDLCTGSSLLLQPGQYASYLWQDMSTASTFNASAVGWYWVTVTDQHNCSSTDSINIGRLLPVPRDFLQATDSICSFEKLLIAPTQTLNSYLWSTGDVLPTITVESPGIYWLQGTDENNCRGIDSIAVVSKPCKVGLFIPNAFTPNNDGKNDVFRATVFGKLLYFKLDVFNRYGQIVFSTRDHLKPWDGLFKGASVSTGAFVWQCQYMLEGEAPMYEKGTVLLIR